MPVQTHRNSIARTRAALLSAVPTLLRKVLSNDAATSVATAKCSVDTPAIGPAQVVSHVARLSVAVLDRLLNRFQWFMAVMPREDAISRLDCSRLRPVLPPPDRIWADPFLVVRDDVTWLFFEEAPFRSARGANLGHISAAPVQSDGRLGAVTTVLQEPWHLSYPQVFEHEGDWYMVPESAAGNRVDLYRCVQWPDNWVHETTLIDGVQGYDPTLWRDVSGYWLLVARKAPGAATSDFLDLYRSDRLSGPWRLVQEAVRHDVRCARPGGKMFAEDGLILRPAQDSSGGVYGRALRIQAVDRIGRDGLAERPLAVIEPNTQGGVVAIHTFAATDDLIAVDLCRRAPRFAWMAPRSKALPSFLATARSAGAADQ